MAVPSTCHALLLLITAVSAAVHPADPSKNVSWPYRSYKSVNYTPPVLNITHHTNPSEGYLFFAPDGATEYQLAPLIFDINGDLIWNGEETHAMAFGAQEYLGQPVLTWWNGTVYSEPIGRGNGVVHLYNNKYEPLHTVTLAGDFLEQVPGATFPSNIDLHELLITKNGSVVVTANNVTTTDLTSVGGPKIGWVVDALVYEIDIATNKVLFSWNALDHLEQVSFNSSYYPLGSEGFTGVNQSLAWGWFHINSAHPYDGGYIISSRFLCSAIAIGKDGNVKWRLDGRRGEDFELQGNNTDFCYQHDIRTFNATDRGVTLHMHDNHNSPIENGTVPTSGKIIDLDFKHKTATLKQRYLNESGPVFSTAQGSFQPLPDGNVFLGHGWIPILEEFDASGKILTTVQFGAATPRPGGGFLPSLTPTLSYRAFKQPWTGCPSAAPDVFAEKSGKHIKVYVSWNGATDVDSWQIYTGKSKKSLKLAKKIKRKGFETEVAVGRAKYVQVRPVLKHGSECKEVESSIVNVS